MSHAEEETRERFSYDALRDFAMRAFTRVGLPPEDAATVATILTNSDLWGIESHGMPLLGGYVRRVQSGIARAQPNIRVVSEYPGTLVLDGDDGLGPVVAAYAMRRAVAKAHETGVSTVTVRNSNHYAACFNYPLMAVAEGMAGMTMTTTGPGVVPTFGAAALLGTNPICIAFPGTEASKPFVIDMATSVVAAGKVGVYRRAGKTLPEGWSYDADMQPTTDPRPRPQQPEGVRVECGGRYVLRAAFRRAIQRADERERDAGATEKRAHVQRVEGGCLRANGRIPRPFR